jgi:hypothetical protein
VPLPTLVRSGVEPQRHKDTGGPDSWPSLCLGVLLVIFLSVLPASAAQWTVGVYMCADNGMNDQADIDIAEMEQVGSTDEVNVVVQVDRSARDPRPGCYRYLIRKGSADTLADLGEVDMADPATLAGFAEFLRSRYPAKNYMLVLWDHGNGWYPGYRTSAIFIDESHGHEMGVAGGELAQAMAGVKQALGKRVRILAFDACLMGMIEVATEVRDACDYMLASEAMVPTDGLPYEKFLDRLTSRPTGTPAELLPGICSDYVEEYPGQQVELSALDMSMLTPALDLMAATLRDSIDPASPDVRAAYATVQTIPGNSFHIDLPHFLELLAGNGSDSLLASLRSAVIVNERSAGLENASGLAIWFPDNYLALKASVASYMTLDFAGESGWPQFLNRYFGTDDVKPEQPVIAQPRQGGRSDVRLWWNSCFDLAPVRYDIYEATLPAEVLTDDGDDFSGWVDSGWTVSTQQAHSGLTSFFSGSASNLANFIESADPLKLPRGGLLSFYAWYKTKEDPDPASAGISRNVCYVEWSPDQSMWHALDSLYGDNRSWHERRYVLHPAEDVYLRFRYVTGSSANDFGVFVDDIKVYSFATMRKVASATPDTAAAVFGVPRDTAGYYYIVTAADSFGNVSMASQLCKVEVKTWAEPYTIPAPFGELPCKLVLDFPVGETTDVLIYTLSGTLVRRFKGVTEHVMDWDGKNEARRELADGLYVVAVQGRDFRKLGKIAKVARPTGSSR